MRAHRILLAIAALALAAPAEAKHHGGGPPHRLVITDPDWVRVPKGAELARLYPADALAKHVSARTKAMCHVLADGALDACVVVEECPSGYGFGHATLLAAQDFQMRPKTVDGVAVEGGTVVVPVVWALDASAPPPPCGPAAEPAVAAVSARSR